MKSYTHTVEFAPPSRFCNGSGNRQSVRPCRTQSQTPRSKIMAERVGFEPTWAEPKRFSRPPRYDRFDISPYTAAAPLPAEMIARNPVSVKTGHVFSGSGLRGFRPFHARALARIRKMLYNNNDCAHTLFREPTTDEPFLRLADAVHIPSKNKKSCLRRI